MWLWSPWEWECPESPFELDPESPLPDVEEDDEVFLLPERLSVL